MTTSCPPATGHQSHAFSKWALGVLTTLVLGTAAWAGNAVIDMRTKNAAQVEQIASMREAAKAVQEEVRGMRADLQRLELTITRLTATIQDAPRR